MAARSKRRAVDLFHIGCPKLGRARVARFVQTTRGLADIDLALNQVFLRCEKCGTGVHIDVWPIAVPPMPPFAVWGKQPPARVKDVRR